MFWNPPVLPADLFVLSPGYEVLPDLATVPPPSSMHGLHSRFPQRQFECSNWRCRHHDVKRIIFSCRNDVMNPYKRSCPDREAVFFGYRLPIEQSAVFVQPFALPEPFRRSPLFSLSNKAALVIIELIASESRCNQHRAESPEPYRWPLHLVLES